MIARAVNEGEAVPYAFLLKMLFNRVIYISRRGIATGRIIRRPSVFNVLSFPRPPGGRRLHFGGRHTIIEHIMNKGRHNRTAELRRFLQTQLDAHVWTAGGELPSFRSFSQKFGLGYGAVQRVMREFHQAGKLEIIPRRGCFVRKTESGDGRPVGILVPDNMMPGGFIETALKAIEKYAVRIGYPLRIIRTREMDLTENNLIEIRSLSAAVLLGEYDVLAIRKLPEDVPLAGMLLQDDFAGTASTVELDPFQSAEFAADFFRKKAFATYGSSARTDRSTGPAAGSSNTHGKKREAAPVSSICIGTRKNSSPGSRRRSAVSSAKTISSEI